MKSNSLLAMAWRNLWRNRRRTLLTLSSIVFGVFLAILFTAMQDQNWADTIDLAARLGGGHVTLQHHEYLETPTLTRTVKNADGLVQNAVQNAHVIRAVPRIVGQIMLSTADESLGASFVAIDPKKDNETTFSVLEAMVEGAYFESSDDKGIILGTWLAKTLGAVMGSRVVYTLTDVNGEIVSGLARLSGVIRTGSPGIDRGLCVLPMKTVQELLNYERDEVTQVAVFVSDQRKSEQVALYLQDRVADEVSSHPWFEIQTELAGLVAMKVGGARFMEILIAVLVAAGIFNTFFVSVMERLREFGILIAIGFSPGRLFSLVMLESLWMALLGLMAAAVFTAGPYYYLSIHGIDWSSLIGADSLDVAGIAMPTRMRVGIFPENAITIVVFAFFATLLSGVYPAWRAGRVEPVETIRLV
jgi:ABC-type lipoprotein release transport system permease subunit